MSSASDLLQLVASKSIGEGVVRQEQFEQLIAGRPWTADVKAATITFGEDTYPMQLLGSYAPDGSWLWAWANETIPPQTAQLANHIQLVGNANDIHLFKTANTIAPTEDAAYFLAVMAASGFSGLPIYWGTNGEGRVALAVDAPLPPLSHPLIVVPRLLMSAIQAPFPMDHRLVVESAFKALEFSTLVTDEGIDGISSDGTIHIGFDDEGRISTLDAASIPLTS